MVSLAVTYIEPHLRELLSPSWVRKGPFNCSMMEICHGNIDSPLQFRNRMLRLVEELRSWGPRLRAHGTSSRGQLLPSLCRRTLHRGSETPQEDRSSDQSLAWRTREKRIRLARSR